MTIATSGQQHEQDRFQINWRQKDVSVGLKISYIKIRFPVKLQQLKSKIVRIISSHLFRFPFRFS